MLRFLLCYLALFLVTVSVSVSAQDVAVVDLESLSNVELEAICTKLGFILLDTDETTGESFDLTREEYLEAARQCLAVQEQM